MLHQRALLVTLSLSIFSPKKTDKRITKKVSDDHHTAAGMLRVSKTILPEEAVEPIRKIHGEIRDFNYAHTLPWGEDGDRLLNSEFLLEYTDRLRTLRREADRAADDFVLDYPTYIENARYQLNGAFNENDYPSVGSIRTKFAVRFDFKPIPAGGDFRITCGEEAMAELRQSVEARVLEAERAARKELAQRIAQPLTHIVTRLTEEDPAFRDTLTGNLRAICDLIPTLNITGDHQLESIRQQILRDLYHSDPETLRDNPTLRASTASKAQNILDTMQGYFAPAA